MCSRVPWCEWNATPEEIRDAQQRPGLKKWRSTSRQLECLGETQQSRIAAKKRILREALLQAALRSMT